MSAQRIGAHEAKSQLSEYLNRVRYGGERVVIERHGKPVAVLIGVEELARIEKRSGGPAGKEARYRESLEEAGVEVSWSERTSQQPSAGRRRRVRAQGKPLSEQIVSDRR